MMCPKSETMMTGSTFKHIVTTCLVTLLLLTVHLMIPQRPLVFQSTLATFSNPAVLGQSIEFTPRSSLPPITTLSRFETKIITKTSPIPRETEYKDDPETEIGIENILEEGKDGVQTKHIKQTFYEGEISSQEVIKTETNPPVPQIISRGTKIVWKTLDTPDGEIRYWRKMRVWATHYDSRCLGCNDWTAIGMRAGKGVIAVDPRVIKLRSQVYVPGYGKAVAGDTGGAIKGNIIDLGFEDAKTAGWSARYVDIYLITQ
jgi:3D (Asp-Asp-Asp) domain-containing protein